MKDSQCNNLNLAQKYAQVLVLVEAHSLSQAMLSETVCFLEQILSMDKYSGILLWHMEVIVYNYVVFISL